MSRNIAKSRRQELSPEERSLRKTQEGKLVITDFRGKILSLLLQGSRLAAACAWEEEAGKVGAVYLGKIKKVVKNINACFVEIAGGELCYLSLEDAKAPFVVNRSYDGRLLEGDELPVQISRDALKTKQAAVTARLSLPGRFLVLTAGSGKVNVSAKIAPDKKETLLEALHKEAVLDDNRNIIRKIRDQKPWDFDELPEFGMVIRTEAGALEDIGPLLEEYHRLIIEFAKLYHNARHRTCFSCLLEPPKPLEAALSIAAFCEFTEIVTDIPGLYASLAGYVHMEKGHPEISVRLYEDEKYPLVKLYSVESRLEEALSSRVWMKSGGYLVIEPTEALTVIDVNSGKFSAGTNMEETFRRINHEAAREIALQLRLRNLSGIIIVDFINMKSREQQEELLQYLKQLTRQDPLTTTVVDITPLGLVELTRRKKFKTLRDQLSGIM